MRRVYTFPGAAMVAVVVGSAPTLALACDSCTEEWAPWAPLHTGHPTCQAQEISIGHPIEFTTAPPLYRHHPGTWNCSAHSDTDCHRLTDCSYEYPAEDSDGFECEWTMQMYDWTIGDFVNVAVPGGNCNCLGANWETGEPDFEPRFQCNDAGEYRAKILVDDTPEDGPHGDDLVRDGYSDSVVLWAPGVAEGSWQVADGWPVCNYPILGGLSFDHDWEPDCCGSRAHLDLVTIRERVLYEGSPCTCEDDPDTPHHHMDHGGDNCFTGRVPYPTYTGAAGNAADSHWFDLHYPPQLEKPYKASLCTEQQIYEWATDWPNAPAPDDSTCCWTPLTSWTTRRYLEQVDGKWRYRITKGEWECTYGDGPGDNLDKLGEHG